MAAFISSNPISSSPNPFSWKYLCCRSLKLNALPYLLMSPQIIAPSALTTHLTMRARDPTARICHTRSCARTRIATGGGRGAHPDARAGPLYAGERPDILGPAWGRGWELRCCSNPTFEFCLRVSGDGTPLRRHPVRTAARTWRTRCLRPTQVAFVRCAKPVSVLCGRLVPSYVGRRWCGRAQSGCGMRGGGRRLSEACQACPCQRGPVCVVAEGVG